MKYKVVVCASGNLGYSALLKIDNVFEICGVITDSKSKNVSEWAELNEKVCFKSNPRKNKKFLKENFFPEFDFLLSINYLYLIEADLINLPRIMAINIHGSLLPKYRGRAPHIWAIINDEKECGITVHRIDEGCDTGDIIIQKKIDILPGQTGGELLQLFEAEYPQLIISAVEIVMKGTELKKQDNSVASYFGKRTPDDGEIDWKWESKRIYNWVRALTKPYPGAFSYLNQKRFFIWKIRVASTFPMDLNEPGDCKKESKKILVKTGDGAIEILEYTFEDPLLDQFYKLRGKNCE